MKSNILFITIDSFRSDRFFGSNRTCKTPHIDSLVNQGLYFRNSISGADSTGISLGNCITGKYSFRNGINQIDLNLKAKNLFNILKNNNYFLYSTTPKLTWFNHLTKNFDEHDDYFAANLTQEDLTQGVGSQIINRLNSKQMKEPWLYYIHLEDLHQQIVLPEVFDDEKFGSTKYDRMVSCVDTWIGKIINEIDLNNTLVIITADHADYIPVIENFGQPSGVKKIMQKGKKHLPFLEPLGLKLFILLRDYRKKSEINKMQENFTKEEIRSLTPRCGKELYEEALRIPLLFVGKNVGKSLIVDNFVGQVDIFPTILSLIDIKYEKNDLNGRDLSVILNDKKIMDKPLYIESSNNEEFRNGFLEGIRTSEFKYLRSKENPKEYVSLYDMKNDPNEFNNIFNEKPEIVDKLEKLLLEMKTKTITEQESEISEEDEKKIREELKKMGYI